MLKEQVDQTSKDLGLRIIGKLWETFVVNEIPTFSYTWNV
jgi:hypothetical protein